MQLGSLRIEHSSKLLEARLYVELQLLHFIVANRIRGALGLKNASPFVHLDHVRSTLVQVRVLVQRALNINDCWQQLVHFLVTELHEITGIDHSLRDVEDPDGHGGRRLLALIATLLRDHSLLGSLAVLQLIFFEESVDSLEVLH